MLSRTFCVSLFAVGLVGVSAQAQVAPKTTVQLPTFNFTTVNTTVNVPDGGSALMGGIKRLSEGRTERGVPILSKIPYINRAFKNVGIGRQTQALMMNVKAKILIQDELEQEVLGQAAASRAARGDRRTIAEMAAQYQADVQARQQALAQRFANERQASLLSRSFERPRSLVLRQETPESTEPSAEEIRQRNEAVKALRDAQAIEFFEAGKSAEAQGKYGSARINYGMAASRAKGQFKQEIQAKLEQLKGMR